MRGTSLPARMTLPKRFGVRVCFASFLPTVALGLLLVAAGCGGGAAAPKALPPVIAGSTVSVAVSPNPSTVQTFGTQQFSATVKGSSNSAVAWTLKCASGGSACGAISQGGFYAAPNSVPTIAHSDGGVVPDTATVVATSQADSTASGTVLVTIQSLNQHAQTLPTKLGVSGGNANQICPLSGSRVECSSGTLGSLVSRNGRQFVLSNNHVLARSDDGSVGDSIIEPGLVDATNPCTTVGTSSVGTLAQFFNLHTGAGTPVDAALAQVEGGIVDSSGSILELGSAVVKGVPQAGAPVQGSGMSPSIGEHVAKSGRSTGVTCGVVEAVNTSVTVDYMSGCSSATFARTYGDAVMISGTGFSAEGDSGSLVVDGNSATPVALLFAGDGSSTVTNPVPDVLQALADSNGNRPTFVGGGPHPVAACNLPPPTSQGAASTTSVAVSNDAYRVAARARDKHAPELLSNPAVKAIGVGPSLDAPGEAAVVLFVRKGTLPEALPASIEGVRGRIVEAPDDNNDVGILGPDATIKRLDSDGHRPAAMPTTLAIERAMRVKDQSATQLMQDLAVKGVGVGTSLDAPGEPALILYVLKGKPQSTIEPTMGGVRIRIKETTGFRVGSRKKGVSKGCRGPVQVDEGEPPSGPALLTRR